MQGSTINKISMDKQKLSSNEVLDNEQVSKLLKVFETLEKLESISNEIDPDSDGFDKDDILNSPLKNLGSIVDAGNYAIGKYAEIVNKGGVMGNGKQVILDELKKVKDIMRPKDGRNRPNPPKPPGTPKGYDTSGGERAKNVQAAGAKPIDVKLSTDITNRTFGDIDFNDDKSIKKTPIIFSRQLLDFSELYSEEVDASGDLVPNSNSILAQYVNSVLNKLNNIAQMRVNFSTSFNYSEIALFLSVLCNALNAYYGIYSIIQFEQDFNNKNIGMQTIRRSITAEDWNVIDIFNQDLRSVPTPPRLPELFYMLNGNYRFEELPKTTILKFTGGDVNSNGLLDFNIPYHIKALNDPKFRAVCRKVVRTIPNWCNIELPMYGPETYHSRNFNTLFENSGQVVKDNNSKWAYTPAFFSNEPGYLSKDFTYLSNANDLDGLTCSLFCAWDYANTPTTDEQPQFWLTGLMKPRPFTKFNNNRAVFYGGAIQDMDDDYMESAPFVNNINRSTGSSYSIGMGYQLEQIYGLSPVSLREMSKELVDWMFDLDSIPGKETKNSGSRNRSRSSKDTNKSEETKG